MKDSARYSVNDHHESLYTECIKSPIGILCIGASDSGLRFIKIIHEVNEKANNPNDITSSAAEQLTAYFNKQLKTFDVPLDLNGYTDFSVRVWMALRNIPFGQTISYLELSRLLGDTKAIRAVGTANGRNPIPIIIPCHRVIGSDGSLTGFALGLDIKRRLLALENPNKFGLIQSSLDLL
ncbi:MAG: methylated-DNA--[protein]-cysteine S-methyltransferase [Saprospiraceae bacterium]|nr:methylated-DNA--[protein]-cysteine S-methyltransferase [Saprospiraceae bacterium]